MGSSPKMQQIEGVKFKNKGANSKKYFTFSYFTRTKLGVHNPEVYPFSSSTAC